MQTVRILVADDHAMFRTALTDFLRGVDGLTIVAQAADGRDAVREAMASRPDICLMDVSMPRLGGIEATRRILRQLRETRVLAMSQYTDSETVGAMLEAGARGFVVKTDALDDLQRAIHAVAAGEFYVSSSLSGVLVEALLRDRHRDIPRGRRQPSL